MGHAECQRVLVSEAHEDPVGASLLSIHVVLGLEYVGKDDPVGLN